MTMFGHFLGDLYGIGVLIVSRDQKVLGSVVLKKDCVFKEILVVWFNFS